MFLFQMVFMDTAATILTGAVAERWTWVSFLLWGVFVGGFMYPIFANWAWGGGWLSQLGATHNLGKGYLDFAGSGVVHAQGGFAALAGAIVLGARLGKYNRDGSANPMPGHNLNMAALGCFILAYPARPLLRTGTRQQLPRDNSQGRVVPGRPGCRDTASAEWPIQQSRIRVIFGLSLRTSVAHFPEYQRMS